VERSTGCTVLLALLSQCAVGAVPEVSDPAALFCVELSVRLRRLSSHGAEPIDILNEHHFIALFVVEQLVDTILDQQHTKPPGP
jgi:hypothetical protein